MKLIEIFSATCICLFVLLGLFLLISNQRRKGLKWLGMFFFLLSFNFIDGLLLLNGFYFDHPFLALWEDAGALLYGPFIFFFILSITTSDGQIPSKNYLHLVPFLILEGAILITFQLQPKALKLDILHSIVEFQLPEGAIFGMIALFAHIFLYLYLSHRKLIQYKLKLKKHYSSVDVTWVTSLLNFLILIFLISLSITFIEFFGAKPYYQIGLLILNITSAVFTFRLVLKALKEPILKNSPEHKYQPKISLDEEKELRNKIIREVEEAEPYKNPSFNLKELSDSLGESTRVVSYVINKLIAPNFYDFVNEFRIRKAKEILNECDSKTTMLEVMYEVGFNSKSSFNVQFKQKVGLTPSQYKKHVDLLK